MYGSEQTDLVVKYYDIAFGLSGEAEVAWYLDKARTFGGPVLDLACGTGRLALMLAQAGLQVTGIDQSAGMLNLFREKLAAQPPEIKSRVHVENQPMSSFQLGCRFGTIICCDAFFHNLTVQQEIDCLSCVADHLAPNGRFVFNVPNPTCEFILRCAESTGREFKERGRYTLADGSGTLLVEQAQAGNALDQTISTTLRVTRVDTEDHAVEQGESAWTTRYLFRYEAIHLLHRCGFEVEALVGNYGGGPVTKGSQLIFQARCAPCSSSS